MNVVLYRHSLGLISDGDVSKRWINRMSQSKGESVWWLKWTEKDGIQVTTGMKTKGGDMKWKISLT